MRWRSERDQIRKNKKQKDFKPTDRGAASSKNSRVVAGGAKVLGGETAVEVGLDPKQQQVCLVLNASCAWP